jgi:hypothetical protein
MIVAQRYLASKWTRKWGQIKIQEAYLTEARNAKRNFALTPFCAVGASGRGPGAARTLLVPHALGLE